jgi:DNA polymerase, archaea type
MENKRQSESSGTRCFCGLTMPDNEVNSDLAVLNERCIRNGIPSPVKFSWNGKPSIKNRIHIDLYEVFKKEIVKGTIFKNRYRTLKLEDVSHALLGKGKYGLGSVSGSNAHKLSVEEQKQYVLQDAQLVMDLSKINNGQIMSLMQAIAELTRLSLEQVCNSSISTWWTKVFDDMRCIPPKQNNPNNNTISEQTSSVYQGGLVIEPKRGLYKNVKVVDAISLYPSVAILHNISFDTVNCACCKNIEDAKVPASVIDKGYWICRQRVGAFPKKLRQFKEERIRQKMLGNEEKQLGLKILINGGYGLFGNPVFKYADVRVAEIITAYGRNTLSYMQELAQRYGFEVIAGDTDSLFLSDRRGEDNKNLLEFINQCHEERGIEVEHQRTFSKFLSIKKKHYIGIDSGAGQSIVKGMEGKKSDRPKWVGRVFDRFVQDFKDGILDPTINVKKAISDLESGRVDAEDLKIYIRLSKEPAEYPNNSIQKRVALYLGAKKGDVIYYYKTTTAASNLNKKQKDATEVPINPKDIDIAEYKRILYASLRDALEIMGYGKLEDIKSDIFNIITTSSRQRKKKRSCCLQTAEEENQERGRGSSPIKLFDIFKENYFHNGTCKKLSPTEAGAGAGKAVAEVGCD